MALQNMAKQVLAGAHRTGSKVQPDQKSDIEIITERILGGEILTSKKRLWSRICRNYYEGKETKKIISDAAL